MIVVFSSFISSSIWQNELAILEFIHLLVETMDRHFGNVVSLWIKLIVFWKSVGMFYFLVCWFSNSIVRARYHVSSWESTLHAGGDGNEWVYCWDKQGEYSDSNSTYGQSIISNPLICTKGFKASWWIICSVKCSLFGFMRKTIFISITMLSICFENI